MRRRKSFPIGHLEDELEEIRRRHPSKRSECGALLEDFRLAEGPVAKNRPAFIYALRGYSRGFSLLERELPALVERMEEPEAFGCPERSLLYSILFAAARIDRPQTHVILAGLVRGASNPEVRADALEAMAFEREQFEWELVRSQLSSDAPWTVLLSTLYALEFQNFAQRYPRLARRELRPFLQHEHPMVRCYAIRTLSFNAKNRKLISEAKDDSDPSVRQAVIEAFDLMEWLSDSSENG